MFVLQKFMYFCSGEQSDYVFVCVLVRCFDSDLKTWFKFDSLLTGLLAILKKRHLRK